MNQNPEQLARDNIDQQLRAVGRVIQNKTQINLAAALGVAVREYQIHIGPAVKMIFSKAFTTNLFVIKLISWLVIKIFMRSWKKNNIKSFQVGY